jgi:hypothetical protein
MPIDVRFAFRVDASGEVYNEWSVKVGDDAWEQHDSRRSSSYA